MLERLAFKLTDSLIAKGADPENREIYAYAIECLVSSAICYALLLIISAFIASFPDMLVWLLFWIPLRTNFGGFHAPTHSLCFTLSLILGTGGVLLAKYFIPGLPVILVCLAFCIVVTFLVAPVVHANKPASDKRQKQAKKTVRIVILCESAAILLVYFIFPQWVASAAVNSVVLAVLFGLLGKAVNRQAKAEEE